MGAIYASAFPINCVWMVLGNLKRGRDVAAFHIGPKGSSRRGRDRAVRAKGSQAKGIQAHNTEVDHGLEGPASEEGALDNDDKSENCGIKAAVEASLSESSDSFGNLLRFNPLVIPPRRSPPPPSSSAYTLFWFCFIQLYLESCAKDCGLWLHPVGLRRQPQVRPPRLFGPPPNPRHRQDPSPLPHALDNRWPARVTATQRSSPDGRHWGILRCGWFVLYKLAKYDIILGKNWIKERPPIASTSTRTSSGWARTPPAASFGTAWLTRRRAWAGGIGKASCPKLSRLRRQHPDRQRQHPGPPNSAV